MLSYWGYDSNRDLHDGDEPVSRLYRRSRNPRSLRRVWAGPDLAPVDFVASVDLEEDRLQGSISEIAATEVVLVLS